jgi:hypothetical protein
MTKIVAIKSCQKIVRIGVKPTKKREKLDQKRFSKALHMFSLLSGIVCDVKEWLRGGLESEGKEGRLGNALGWDG